MRADGPMLLDAAGRLVVAGAFVLAAVGKLADLRGLRATLYLSRVTRPWVPQLSVALPAVELLLAAGLLGVRAAWFAALATAALLLAFIAYLGLDPAAGQGCDCFGRARPRGRRRAAHRAGSGGSGSRRAGIFRDVVLVAALVPVLLRGPGAARIGVPPALEPAAGSAAVVLVVALLVAAVRRGRRPGRQPGQPPGPGHVPAPFDLPTLAGSRLRSADLPGRGSTVLVFVETGCARCEELLPLIAGHPQVVVLAAGERAEVSELARRHQLPAAAVALDLDGVVADAYRVRGTPSGVRLDGVGSGAGSAAPRVVAGADAVAALLRHHHP